MRQLRLVMAGALGLALTAPLGGLAAKDVDQDAVTRAHKAALPFDAHLDIPETFDPAHADAHGQGQFDLALAAAGGLRGGAIALFVPQEAETPEYAAKALRVIERKHGIITGIAARFPGKAAIALTPADFVRIAASGRFAIVESVVNGGAFVAEAPDVDAWFKRGVRIFGFVHAGHNRLADSSRPAAARGEGRSRSGGLSEAGKRVLARLNALGVLVDVSQLSGPAFADVLRLSTAPVIATHTDVRGLIDNSRNLTDAQLDALKTNGGVIAINAFSAYLRPRDPAFTAKFAALRQQFGLTPDGKNVLPPNMQAEYEREAIALHTAEPPATLADLGAAVDYAVHRIGIDHVALSSDFNHGGGIAGWQNEGEARGVTEELVRRGYDAAAIRKLWSGNVLRVWAEAQAKAAASSPGLATVKPVPPGWESSRKP